MSGSAGDPIKLKILIVGSSSVGKSSLLKRFVDDTFSENTSPTIGMDFVTKEVFLDDKHVRLALWDTAGTERYQSITPSYYRNANGVILVYDVTARHSFDELETWVDRVDSHVDRSDVVKMLIGNKIDLSDSRVINREAGLRFARENSMLFVESSAKTSDGVKVAFEELVLKILENPQIWRVDRKVRETRNLDESSRGWFDFWPFSFC